jgi:hypothetical protein
VRLLVDPLTVESLDVANPPEKVQDRGRDDEGDQRDR